MDWTLEDNRVNGLVFCATLTSHRSSHTLFVQTGTETCDTRVEVVKLDTRCSWQGHSRRVGRDENMESCSALQHFRIPLVVR